MGKHAAKRVDKLAKELVRQGWIITDFSARKPLPFMAGMNRVFK